MNSLQKKSIIIRNKILSNEADDEFILFLENYYDEFKLLNSSTQGNIICLNPNIYSDDDIDLLLENEYKKKLTKTKTKTTDTNGDAGVDDGNAGGGLMQLLCYGLQDHYITNTNNKDQLINK